MKTHNKLVRDNIPAVCEANGETPKTRILENDTEYLNALLDKLVEEALETKENPSPEELGDVLEAVLSIGKVMGYTPDQLETARKDKAKKLGGFDKRIFLISTKSKA